MKREPIAIVGMGMRFPGGADDAALFWRMLVERREGVCEVPADRWNAERFYDSEPGISGKTIAKAGGFLGAVDAFDPQFFGISPREAPYIDPQQRLLLETAWEAIEDAGMVLDFVHGTDMGVFVGVSHNDYQGIQHTPTDRTGISSHTPTGTAHSIAANRISYCLNLGGPSIAMDTACSSALTAVHVACDHLWAGRCASAMAGGVTVMIAPDGFIGFSQAGMLSPTGKCRAFDAAADGFVRGEGAGMVLLKRLGDALADGDPVHAVILGSSLNQDGHTNGISLPSPEAQTRLVRDACRDAGIDPLEMAFVEAHGTGTAVGDPIEAHALAGALCEGRAPGSPLLIGSVKTNLGHLETASGIAGLIKAVLVLKHGKIPGSLHFQTPSPHIDFQKLNLRIPTDLEPFPGNGARRIAGVNSFGFGGANAHVILADPPPAGGPQPGGADQRAGGAWPVVVSARSETALRTCASRLGTWIAGHAQSNGSSPLLPDLAYTLGARRNHHAHRLAFTARSTADAVGELEAFAAGGSPVKARAAFAPRGEPGARIGFVMSGQGTQSALMGSELMRTEPVFREMIEACAEAMRPWAGFSLLEELARPEATSGMHRTEVSQPAIFAMQMGLAALWKSWGVSPSAAMGHSVGEVAAACVAGILTLGEAARVIVLRGRCMDERKPAGGTMLAVGMDEAEALEVIARHDASVAIAAFNAPRSLTLAGKRDSLERIARELESREIFARFLLVDYPFHHPMMQPSAGALAGALGEIHPASGDIPVFSTVTGGRLDGRDFDAHHWVRGVTAPVRFAPALDAMAGAGVDVWIEIGSHPALVRSVKECLGGRGTPVVFASMRRENERESLLETAMDLHLVGVALDFKAMTPSRRLLNLPAYPWERNRWWIESREMREGRLAPGGRGLLDVRLPRASPAWLARLDARHMAFLRDHKVENLTIFPAAGFVGMAVEAGLHLFEGKPFVIEDFEIRRPLILPEVTDGLLLELACDAEGRQFSIQSRFEGASSWGLHVVGCLRGERTESRFASSLWAPGQPADFEESAPAGFYEHLSDMGLFYGEEFRPIRELSVGCGQSRGRVCLSEAAARRAGEFPLHPVILDGALQVFSAGATTIEGRNAGLRLPVRFDRITFLRSPGSTALVSARASIANEEMLEGAIDIYDAHGEPAVRIDGFRAIGVEGVRRQGTSGKGRDLVYHEDWERCPRPNGSPESRAPDPLPVARMCAAAKDALGEILATRPGLEAANADREALTLAQVARGFHAVSAGQPFSAESLGVTPAMRPAFARLAAQLTRLGLLTESAGGFCPTPALETTAASVGSLLGGDIAKHPGHLAEAMLCEATTSRLGAILRGETEAVNVLFSGDHADALDLFYSDSPAMSPFLAAIARAVAEAARHLPEGRGLRILEVGAGTGGLAAMVLPLLEPGLHRYVFTDVSASFFTAARQKLAAFPGVEFTMLDLDRPPEDQGFSPGSFDIILGANVLHAVGEIRPALRRLRELLVAGGALMFVEVASPHLWLDAVFGLTPGWWRFADRDLRPGHPLLARAQWEDVLRGEGFDGVSSIAGLVRPNGEESLVALVARNDPSRAQPEGVPDGAPVPREHSWLVVADASGLGDRLAQRLVGRGMRCRVAGAGREFSAGPRDAFTLRVTEEEDWGRLFAACAADPPERVVFLGALDASPPPDGAAPDWTATESLLLFARALAEAWPGRPIRLDVVTRAAQAAGRPHPVSPAQAPVIGLFRVIANEYPNITCRGIDLSPRPLDAGLALLESELCVGEAEREVALREEARYVRRIARGLPESAHEPGPAVPLRLVSRERGHLGALRLAAVPPPVCRRGEVVIDVKAAGMNFRDVLKALGLYPSDAPDARLFGDEVAGVVRSVGRGVRGLVPGDRVFGLAVSGLATQAVARAGDVRPIPGGLSFEEAATLPVVFMTAWHALKTVGRLAPGERVLVHAGAGGVGMAAVQIARHLGAEVIATAGSPAKRALLRTLGVAHVMDSRRADFVGEVMEVTGGRGVDMVLNSLASEAIPMGLACLGQFGRFIEIGKRDIYQNARIPLWPMRNNASFHVVAMDAIFGGSEVLTRRLLKTIAGLVERGVFHPLPHRAFPACRLDAAFRLMASGKHTGKILGSFAAPFLPNRAGLTPRPFVVDPRAVYLVTGAFGGFGRVVANWLVECGARRLVLCGRRGASTSAAVEFLGGLKSRGVKVRQIRADAGTPGGVDAMLAAVAATGRPLKGVFHLAMVIDDAPVASLTPARMRAVMDPKAGGAWMLHERTRAMDLDAFVMFSSVSSTFGNPGQGNYAAANAFLDALARHRHAMGLPALAINWGALGGEGYVARNERVAEFLARQGTLPITPREVTTLMESLLSEGVPQVVALRADWAKWRNSVRGSQDNPLMERVFADAVDGSDASDGKSDWRSRIENAAPDNRPEVITQAVMDVVGSVLRVKPGSLRPDQPLTDLGLDSLLAVEIETSLDASLGVVLPPASLMRARTIQQIAALIAEYLAGSTEAPASPPPHQAPAQPEESPDLGAFSDDDIARLLGDEPAANTEDTRPATANTAP